MKFLEFKLDSGKQIILDVSKIVSLTDSSERHGNPFKKRTLVRLVDNIDYCLEGSMYEIYEKITFVKKPKIEGPPV